MKKINLTMQEKYLSVLGLALILFIMYIFYFFMPISADINSYQQKSIQMQVSFQQLKNTLPRIEKLKSQGASINFKTITNMRQFIKKQIENSSLHQRLIAISGDANQVKLQFGNIRFDVLIQWIQDLWQTDKISVQSINIHKTNASGLVNVDIILHNNKVRS